MSLEFQTAFKNSIPVMMGYCVLGFALGLLMASIGVPWYWVGLMSLLVYAGALQFAAVGFLSTHMSLPEIAMASFFINIRHAFYGLSLLKHYAKAGLAKLYLIHSLTDETYGVLTGMQVPDEIHFRQYALYLSALHQSYWMIGTLAGVLFGSSVPFDTRGLSFSLTALFVVLTIEQYKAHRRILPFIIGAVASAVAWMLLGTNMLLGAIVIALVMLFALRSQIERSVPNG